MHSITTKIKAYPDGTKTVHMVAPSGEYEGDINEQDNTVTFDVVYEGLDIELNEDSWPDVVGYNHVFIYLMDQIGGEIIINDADTVSATFNVYELMSL